MKQVTMYINIALIFFIKTFATGNYMYVQILQWGLTPL